MRALQVTRPGFVEVVDVPQPKRADDEFLLKVQMVGMCGSDLNTYLGKNPMVSYPRVLGHEIAAEVAEVPKSSVVKGREQVQEGSSVTVSPYTACGECSSCKRGRPNACVFNQTYGVQRDGAMTEFISVKAEKIYAAEGLSPTELAIVEPLTIGFHAVARGRVTHSDTVGVFGCGGVGIGAIVGAARQGATVIAIDVDYEKLELAKASGARYAVHSKDEDLHERLQELTGGRGPDVMIEAIGLPATFRSAVEEVAFTGRVVYIGYAKEPVAYETRLFVQKELDIRGSRNASPEDFHDVIRALQEKALPVDRAVSRIVPLEEAGQALQEWSANPSRFQKILVRVSGLK